MKSSPSLRPTEQLCPSQGPRTGYALKPQGQASSRTGPPAQPLHLNPCRPGLLAEAGKPPRGRETCPHSSTGQPTHSRLPRNTALLASPQHGTGAALVSSRPSAPNRVLLHPSRRAGPSGNRVLPCSHLKTNTAHTPQDTAAGADLGALPTTRGHLSLSKETTVCCYKPAPTDTSTRGLGTLRPAGRGSASTPDASPGKQASLSTSRATKPSWTPHRA